MKDTYLMVNGQKIELTEEQKKQLGIVEEKSCFDRVIDARYYYINCEGKVYATTDTQCSMDSNSYSVANYCTDKDLLYQRSLHEILHRLLWRYSMTHDGDKIDWNNWSDYKYVIYYNHNSECVTVERRIFSQDLTCIYFFTEEIAQGAIKEIVAPFMKEHPDFVW